MSTFWMLVCLGLRAEQPDFYGFFQLRIKLGTQLHPPPIVSLQIISNILDPGCQLWLKYEC